MQIMYSDGARKGRLLDVGCGSGEFLAQMRELGWDVFGVEPDPQAARVAREQFGLTVWPGALAEASFPDGFFDAVTLNHVIEHVADPPWLAAEVPPGCQARGICNNHHAKRPESRS